MEKRLYIFPEAVHRCMAMVSGDVVVHLLPESFDSVVIGRIRGKKVNLHASPEIVEHSLSPTGLVDDVVVGNEMDSAGSSIVVGKSFE